MVVSKRMSKNLVEKFEDVFKDYDYIVTPSVSLCKPSCSSTTLNFISKNALRPGRPLELVQFLHDVLKVKELPGRFEHVVTVHNSCHGVRELRLSSPSEEHIPRYSKIVDLLSLKEGITVKEPERIDECCGFGGMFAIEEPDVSSRMGER